MNGNNLRFIKEFIEINTLIYDEYIIVFIKHLNYIFNLIYVHINILTRFMDKTITKKCC